MKDAIVEMNAEHLASEAVTVYEALEDEGLVTAAINVPAAPGRDISPPFPGLVRPVNGPTFFYYSLFQVGCHRRAARRPGPRRRLGRRLRRRGQALARHAGRLRLPVLLPAGLRLPPPRARPAARPGRSGGATAPWRRSSRPQAVWTFLDRYDIVVCSDHGQTHVDRAIRIGTRCPATRTSSSRPRTARGWSTSCRRRGRREVGGRAAESLRRDRRRPLPGRWRIARAPRGREIRLGQGDGDWRGRAWQALANPNAGDVIVSAAPGVEFADLGRRHHAGGARTARCSTETQSSRCSS